MGEAVGGLVQQGAEDVDRATLEAFAADQDLGPVGELPAAGGEVARLSRLWELAGGLEPPTCCLQDSCAADCATPAGS
jgi:hypothetical protein